MIVEAALRRIVGALERLANRAAELANADLWGLARCVSILETQDLPPDANPTSPPRTGPGLRRRRERRPNATESRLRPPCAEWSYREPDAEASTPHHRAAVSSEIDRGRHEVVLVADVSLELAEINDVSGELTLGSVGAATR